MKGLRIFFALVFLTLLNFVSSFSSDVDNANPSGDNDVFSAVGGFEAVQASFESFVDRFNKVYVSPIERQNRMRIFAQNLRRYAEMNKADRGTAVYGVDAFSDWTFEEFKEKFMGLKRPAGPRPGKPYNKKDLNKKIPTDWDWREKGAVSPIKYQGGCGSCWAFSAVANLEGLYYIKHKQMELFSEQQIVDCDKKSFGCEGGWMTFACEYVRDAGGLERSSDYPYTYRDGTCAFNKSAAILKVNSVVSLPRDEKKIAAYLHSYGPVSVALDANGMWGYKSGIAHPPESICSKKEDDLNHGITLVGYGVKVFKEGNKKKKLPFWVAKNSWSERFGDKGYYYLYRGDGSCGINLEASSATIE